MKSFFATAAIAAIVAAYDGEDAVEDIMNGNPEHAVEELAEEAAHEGEDAFNDFMEEIECWWADRNNGDGECAMRTRWEEQNDCWMSGNEWYYDTQECLTREEVQERREWDCVNQEGGEWIPLQEGWEPECFTGDIWQVCMMSNMEVDWETEECVTYEELQARSVGYCEADGGEWTSLREGWGEQCYIAGDDVWADCIISGPDMEYNWEFEQCMTAEESCTAYGNEYVTDEWGYSWCNYQWLSMKSKIQAVPKSKLAKIVATKPVYRHILATYTGEFNIPELEAIGAPVEAGEQEGQELFESAMDDMKQTAETWIPLLEQWQQEQQAREEQAFGELATVVVDSVYVDGTSLRDLVGGPENWFLAKQQRRAKNIRQVILQETTAENVSISFEGPSEQEFNDWLAGIQAEGEALGAQLQEISEYYEEEFEDLEREMEREMEDVIEESGEPLINRIGDDVKAVTDSFSADWYALASKKPKAAATSSSKTGFYAGLGFGMVGALAVAGVVSGVNKKQVKDNEETLL